MTEIILAEEWLRKGLVLAQSQEYEKALMAYEQAIKINPQYPDVWVKKGDALGALNRHLEAVTAYDAAIQINPSLSQA